VLHGFTGFAAPVDDNGVVNVAEAGRSVPLQWTLADASGAPVSTATVTAIRVFT
jgi:hypothetical protein